MATGAAVPQDKTGQKWRVLKRGARVGDYRVSQVAGQDDAHALYLATQRDSDDLVWLLQAHPTAAGGATAFAGLQTFEEAGARFIVFPTEGASLASISQLVSSLNWNFIVPLWVDLLRTTAYLHARGKQFQGGRPLDLGSILFGHEGQLLPLSFTNAAGKIVFRAPELDSGTPTPESDVYALGAALLFVLGGGTPQTAFLNKGRAPGQLSAKPELARVLARATDPDPQKRYRDADEFAAALSRFAPKERPPVVAKGPVKISPLNAVFILLLLCIGSLALVLFLNQPLLNSLAFGAAPTRTAQPNTIPDKPISLEVLNFDIAPDGVGRIDVVLNRDGTPVPYGPPVQFSVSLNGQEMQITTEKTQTSPAGDTGRYRLNFTPLANLLTGTYLVTARLIGNSISKTIYYEASPAAAAVETPAPGALTSPESGPTVETRAGLAGLSITGLQIDTRHYPDLDLYFTLSNQDGGPARIRGAFNIQVDQDDQRVSELVMIPNDPTNNPITTALALDVSGSMQGVPITNAVQAASEFVQALGARDNACVYTFSTSLSQLSSCSADHQASLTAIKGITASGNTALYQITVKIADDLSAMSGRKAIILLSDGADTASTVGKEFSLSRLQETNIPVYAIGLSSYQFQPQIMREFASRTGGSYLEAPSSESLRQLYALINSQLRNQYRITFKSAFPSRTSGNITVRLLKDGDKIEATRGFTVAK